jgi:hypothetical protein
MPTIRNETRRREYARELALVDATYPHVAFSSTEERAPPPNAVDVPFWRTHFFMQGVYDF